MKSMTRARMYLGLICSLVMVLPAVAQDGDEAKMAGVAAVAIDRISSFGGGYSRNIVAGWEFETTARAQITDLGVWDTDGDGLSEAMPVKVWDAAGKEVATGVVPKGKEGTLSDQFRYVKIEPVDLEAGQRYVIAALYTPKVKDGTIHGGANVSLAPPVRWIRHRRALTDELTLPEIAKSAPDHQELPGSFGPTFRLAESKVTRGVRDFYRIRYLPAARRSELIIVPEQEDGSHRFDKYLTISLYASPDGKLTQVVFDDLPLGTGDKAFARLATEVQKFRSADMADRPIVRVVSMSKVSADDLRTVVNIKEEGRFRAGDAGRDLIEGEVQRFEGRVKQPERDGKHVASDRFKDSGDYVEDRWTGLLWQKDGAASGKRNFLQAADYAKELELSGIKGWRVPTIEELATIFPATYEPFTNTRFNSKECCAGPDEFPSYWTSQFDERAKDCAFVFHWYAKGGANNCYASKNFVYVRCVHDSLKKE